MVAFMLDYFYYLIITFFEKKLIPFSLNLTCDRTTTRIIVEIATLVFTEDRYLYS